MPDKKKHVLGAFLQLGDQKEVDTDEIDAKIRLFSELAKAIDGGVPKIETVIAFAAMKVVVERMLGFNVDVGVRETGDRDPEEVAKELKDEFERTGRIREHGSAPQPTLFKRPGSTDPTFH